MWTHKSGSVRGAVREDGPYSTPMREHWENRVVRKDQPRSGGIYVAQCVSVGKVGIIEMISRGAATSHIAYPDTQERKRPG